MLSLSTRCHKQPHYRHIASIAWSIPFQGPTVSILLLLIFRSYILTCLINFVSSHLEAIKVQMILQQGYEPTQNYHPLDTTYSVFQASQVYGSWTSTNQKPHHPPH